MKRMIDDSVLTDIADAIREKNSTDIKYKDIEMAQAVRNIPSPKEEQEKTVDITENGTTEIPADDGKVLSKVTVNVDVADSYDEFEYIRSRGYTDYNNWFNGFRPLNGVGDLVKIMPKHTKSGTNFSRMFYESNVLEIPYFDTSNGTNFFSMFGNCNWLTKVPAIDVSNGTKFTAMFYGCGASEISYLNTVNGTDFNNTFSNNNIKKLGGFNLSSAGKGKTNYLATNAFNCSNLEEISRIEGVIPVSISLKSCSLLNVASAKRVLMALVNYTGTENEFVHSVLFADSVWELLNAEGATAPGNITWEEYVNSIGWNK